MILNRKKIFLKYSLYLILFFAFSKNSYSQTFVIVGTDTINFVDANGLKQGHWNVTNKTKKLEGYKDDQKVEEGYYKDGKKTGIWKQYYPNGTIKSEITFVNNRPFGYAKFYFSNGKLSEEGMWENSRWVGKYKMYYETGQIFYEFQYNEQGKREGEQKYFHENGKVMIEGNWQDGKEGGIIKEYYSSGNLKSEKNFKNGELDSAPIKIYEDNPESAIKVREQEVIIKDKTSNTIQKKEGEPVVPNSTTGNKEEENSPTSTSQLAPSTISVLSDGFHKTFNKNKLVDKEGIFKNGKLVDGKIYEYNDKTLKKTIIIKNAKVTEVIESK
jgi:antitoxin component YwqK of YwqJK toxin-antitoxin module